ALMPEDQRKDFVKKLVKDLRKQQGLKDEPGNKTSPFNTPTNPTLFPSVQPKGEWYFYNADFRTRGQNDFRNKWGNRPNADNWRRGSALSSITINNANNNSITNNPN